MFTKSTLNICSEDIATLVTYMTYIWPNWDFCDLVINWRILGSEKDPLFINDTSILDLVFQLSKVVHQPRSTQN